MSTFFEILSPSYLLFPALLGTAIMGLVCPLIGAYLVLRRTVFLGLTLPQIAAAGVSFTFWLRQTEFLPQWGQGERGVGMIGSLVFTFLGMGLLGYLEQRGRGLAEGRLAAAYALAGALTILFIVFNPAGQIEVLNLLKGEVIALSRDELSLLAVVFGMVLLAILLFRREFLLTSFDRDLAFLLKGRQVIWDVLLYLLAGVSIAFGVIMAGPLLLFGFLVLPALAARPLVNRMSTFLLLSAALGLVMALLGFYSSVRLDLPLGPTDVALGCALVFLAYGLRPIVAKTGAIATLLAAVFILASGCVPREAARLPAAESFPKEPVWLFRVKNSSALTLRLPATNPLYSLAEMAGKVSPDSRETVMDLLRASLRQEFGRHGFQVQLPEEKDVRLSRASPDPRGAMEVAREGGLSGLMFFTDIRRWEADSRQIVRVWVEFRMVRSSDGTLLWERRIQRAVPTPSATNLGQSYTDAVKEVVQAIFE
jgi:ABC-type Mn2+/Zn2+ transport system permease subunit